MGEETFFSARFLLRQKLQVRHTFKNNYFGVARHEGTYEALTVSTLKEC